MDKTSIIILAVVMSVALAATTTQAPAAENGFSKMVGSFNSSIKSGFSKVAKTISPKPPQTNTSDATSLYVKANPSPKLYVAAAKMHVSNGNLQDAEDMYKKALKISPKYADALTGYAQLKDKMGSYGEAVALYEKAAKAHPQDATVFNGMGLCHATHGNFERALSALQRAVDLQPRELKYRNNIAMVLVEMGRYDAAFAHFKTQYDDSVAHYNLGYLIQKRGDKPRAIRHFAAAIEKNPNLSEARVWYDHLAGPQTPGPQTPVQQRRAGQQPVQQQRQVVDGPALAARQPQHPANTMRSTASRPRAWLPRQQAQSPQSQSPQRPLPQRPLMVRSPSKAQRQATARREATAQQQLNALGPATAPAAPGKTDQRYMAFRPRSGSTARTANQSPTHRLPPIEQSFGSTPPVARQFAAPLAPTPQISVRAANQFQRPTRPSPTPQFDRTAPLPGLAAPMAPPASGTTRAPMIYPLPPVDNYRN